MVSFFTHGVNKQYIFHADVATKQYHEAVTFVAVPSIPSFYKDLLHRDLQDGLGRTQVVCKKRYLCICMCVCVRVHGCECVCARVSAFVCEYMCECIVCA